jgi:adenosylmethionine-8-amino-7-oxononanoate aminotransferase
MDRCQESISVIHYAHQNGIDLLKKYHKNFFKIRLLGTVLAFELKNKSFFSSEDRMVFFKNGLLMRPLGGVLYLIPPYSTEKIDLEKAYDVLLRVLHSYE